MKSFPMLDCAAHVLDGAGFPATATNLRIAADDLRVKLAEAYKSASGKVIHGSDCATSLVPAEDPAPCDCHISPRSQSK